MDDQSTEVAGRPAGGDAGPGEPKLTQLDATLEHLGRLCVRLEQAEQRFKQMTDECSNVLDGLVSVDRRHATTLATLNDRLGDWCSIERKLLEESARRIERFERGVEHEWTALRRLHEEPLDELRAQADKLRLACLDAASLARQRLDAAEQGYATQAADLERRLAEWTRRVLQAPKAITDGSSDDEGASELATAAAGSVEPWPLDGVAQLHQELRTGATSSRPRSAPAESGEDDTTARVPTDNATQDAPAAHARNAVENAPPAGDAATPAPAVERPRRRAMPIVASLALVGVVMVIVALYVSQMQRRLVQLEAQTREATAQMNATRAAAQARNEAAAADVQQAANRTGRMLDILAAPDLRRYDLSGVGPGQGAYGQVLWSRAHGMAVTAMRLPPASDKIYRVWVQGDGRLAAAGVLEFEGAGTARFILGGPLALPRPVVISVTLEHDARANLPAGPVFLLRVPAPTS